MQVSDLRKITSALDEIKSITDKQEYLISSYVNERYNTICAITKNEIERMESKGVEINCPKILILKHTNGNNGTFTECINKQLEELIRSGFKIIDYGLTGVDGDTCYIKYTD